VALLIFLKFMTGFQVVITVKNVVQ